MVRCSILGCKSDSEKKIDGLSFHSFPTNTDLRNLWIKSTKRKDWVPKKSSKICSQHFTKNDNLMKIGNKTYLNPEAVPVEFPETPEADEQADIRRRSLSPLIKQSKEIIARVYNYLQTEYEELKSSLDPSVDLSPLANIPKRTALATGISEHTVSAILEEKKRSAVDELDAGAAKRAKLTHDAGDGDASEKMEENGDDDDEMRETDGSNKDRKINIQINDVSDDEKKDEEIKRKRRERNKRHRENKKYKLAIPVNEEIREAEKHKNREKTKRYREKKKNRGIAEATVSITSDSFRQKNAEKCKRYRDKKRMSQFQTKNMYNSQNDLYDAQITRPENKPNADRQTEIPHRRTQELAEIKLRDLQRRKSGSYEDREHIMLPTAGFIAGIFDWASWKRPITDDGSSSEAPNTKQDHVTKQEEDNEQTEDDSQEREKCSVVTMKVEIGDETYYRPPDPLQWQASERNSAAEHQLPVTNIANFGIKTEPVHVKIEPVDTEYPQFSSGVVPVTSLPRVKTEPDDDPCHSSTARESDVVSATLCDVTSVKSEPPS